MAIQSARRLINGWETVRYELLNTRICDMNLRIDDSPVEPYVLRLYHELRAKGLYFEPPVYATDIWGCPDGVPVIGVPFYLCDKRLARIEEEQTGEIEDPKHIMMLLRHEAGHAINYAYRLFKRDDWAETFGNYTRAYLDRFRPNPMSRAFVRHLIHHRYGRTYAQKHPDEDFAETFAVWLTPRSGWRRRYRNWPALEKLRYVDRLMKSLAGVTALVSDGKLCTPAEEMDIALAEHYGQRAERYRAEAQGFVDDKLRELFPDSGARKLIAASDLIHKHRAALQVRVTQWSGMEEDDVALVLAKFEDRARALDLYLRPSEVSEKLLDLTAMATAVAMDFTQKGRLASSSNFS